MGNNRRKIELLNALLLSLPGTPIIYYGDELGMGDNIYLGDRNAVRTPMQWNANRNAGFSNAGPQQLYLPVVVDYEYHYETVNVETQQNNPNSLLSWMKRLIALRQGSPALGQGTLEMLNPSNPKVLAFVRTAGDQRVLVAANLSRFPQYAELDLRSLEGQMPVELFGQAEFPRIGQLPYLLTFGSYEFYWFALRSRRRSGPLPKAARYRRRARMCRWPHWRSRTLGTTYSPAGRSASWNRCCPPFSARAAGSRARRGPFAASASGTCSPCARKR